MSNNPFNNKQLDVLKFNNNFTPYITIQEGAVRTGKTIIDNYLWLIHVSNFKNRGLKFIMSSTTLGTLKKNVLDELEDMFGIDTHLNIDNEFQLLGNTMCCFGSDKADSYKRMKGFTAYGALVNEATEHHKNTLDQIIKRCSGAGSRVFMDTNPANPNHYVKTDYIDKSGEVMNDGSLFIKSWHWVLEDNAKENNGFLDPRYIEGLKKATPSGHLYDRDILGLWVAAEGMIYKDYDESKHVISLKEYKEKYENTIIDKWGCIDWGYEHNGVIIIKGRDSEGVVYNIDSKHGQHIDINEPDMPTDWKRIALEFATKYGRNIPFYYDTARPDAAKVLKRVVNMKPASKEVLDGITKVSSLYKTNKKRIVRETNPLFFDEIYTYVWKENSLKEEPLKENDDYMDCDRYGDYTHLEKQSGVRPLRR